MANTPTKHLSWTQLDLIERSQSGYISRYILGEKFVTPEMEYGKYVAQVLAGEIEIEHDPGLANAMEYLPRYPKAEFKLEAKLKAKGGVIPLLGYADGFDYRKLVLDEIKTGRRRKDGKASWTQSTAEKHPQLHFYALMIYLKYGRLPKEIRVSWIETEKNWENGIISATGYVEVFHVAVPMEKVLAMAARAERGWKMIQEVTKKHIEQII